MSSITKLTVQKRIDDVKDINLEEIAEERQGIFEELLTELARELYDYGEIQADYKNGRLSISVEIVN